MATPGQLYNAQNNMTFLVLNCEEGCTIRGEQVVQGRQYSVRKKEHAEYKPSGVFLLAEYPSAGGEDDHSGAGREHPQ